MKKSIIIFIIAVIAVVQIKAQSVFQNAAETTEQPDTSLKAKKITGSFEMNYLRHYLWRGMLFGNNDVAQPVLELNYNGFTVSLSQNLNYVPKNVPKEYYTRNTFFDEQDVTISYSKTRGRLSTQFSAMAYFYFYQLQSPNTAELYNYTSYNFYKNFSIFTENSIDFAAYKGAVYSNNGILFEKALKHNFDIECNVYAAFANRKFNDIYYSEAKPGLNLVGTNLSITKNLGKYFIKALAEKNYFTRNNVKQSVALNGTGNFGIAAGFNF